MRKIILILIAAATLSGCVSLDDRARRDCEREHRGTERAMC